MSELLEVDDIQCGYGGASVVDGFDMSVPRGGLICLLGPSGCGKTTVLRAIAGFNPVTRGRVLLRGETVSEPGRLVPPEHRGIGMVFQDYALFPHLTVEANVAFGLRGKQRGRARAAVSQLLDLVGLKRYQHRYPHELSGGQQQRIALARALAPAPDLLLLDEPFSNLDVERREQVSSDVAQLLRKREIAAVLVTHDQHEAFALGEQVGVMRDGEIVQWDTPYNLYHRPATRFVANFIGQGVFLRGRLIGEQAVETELGVLRGRRVTSSDAGSEVDVLLRPDDVIPDADGSIAGMVTRKAFRGAESIYTLALPTGQTVLSLFPSHLDVAVGDHVSIRVDADHLVTFPADSVTDDQIAELTSPTGESDAHPAE